MATIDRDMGEVMAIQRQQAIEIREMGTTQDRIVADVASIKVTQDTHARLLDKHDNLIYKILFASVAGSVGGGALVKLLLGA